MTLAHWKGQLVTDVVEVYWNARTSLALVGIKPEKVAQDPRAEAFFGAVRLAVIAAFPGVPTLVRIAVKSGDPEADLRVMRGGAEQKDGLEALRDVIEQVVGQSTRTQA